MVCLDTTMLRKFENENKNQKKKNQRLKIYGKIRNGRLKLEPSVLIKKRVMGHSTWTSKKWGQMVLAATYTP